MREARVAQEILRRASRPDPRGERGRGGDRSSCWSTSAAARWPRSWRTAPLGLERTLSVVADVGAALDALHRGGIVHRDVKPSNVMLREDGSAALTDFGLAKGAAYTVLTRPGQVHGTLDYLAPELIRGADATPASDVYALGCVAFECLAGRPPFADRSLFGVGTAHLEDEPPDPPTSTGRLAGRSCVRSRRIQLPGPPTATMYAHLLRVASRP